MTWEIIEGLLKVTRSHIHHKSGKISEMVLERCNSSSVTGSDI